MIEDLESIFVTEQEIRERVEVLGNEISETYADVDEITIIAVTAQANAIHLASACNGMATATKPTVIEISVINSIEQLARALSNKRAVRA